MEHFVGYTAWKIDINSLNNTFDDRDHNLSEPKNDSFTASCGSKLLHLLFLNLLTIIVHTVLFYMKDISTNYLKPFFLACENVHLFSLTLE